MTWFRVGDTSATDPRVLALHDPTDPLIFPAAFGFLTLLGTLSASNGTDYVINTGFINLAGGSPAAGQDLLKRCVRAGLITHLDGKGARKRWKLIDDAPELFHLRLRAEVDWERNRRSDTDNERFRILAYLRDGDACRYCGVPVQPSDNKSPRGKTLDHITSGQRARTADDLVVCCRRCNGARGQEWQAGASHEEMAERWQLLAPPTPLFFVASTVSWLEERGHTVPTGSVIATKAKQHRTTQTSGPDTRHPATPAGVAAPARPSAPGDQHPAHQAGVAAPESRTTTGATHPGSQPGVAAPPAPDQHPAPAGVAVTADSTTAPECTQHPASQAGVAGSESRIDRTTTDRSGTAAPGRVGSGRVGPGRVGSPPPQPSPAHPPEPPQSPASPSTPRRTRRGRRRSRPT